MTIYHTFKRNVKNKDFNLDESNFNKVALGLKKEIKTQERLLNQSYCDKQHKHDWIILINKLKKRLKYFLCSKNQIIRDTEQNVPILGR